MVADGDENVGRARRRGEPPRKRIEIAHLALALARDRGVPLGLAREVGHHDGDHHVEQQVQDFLGRGDAETIELGEEQVARQQDAGDGADQRRNHAELIAGHHDGDQVQHRAA